MKLRLCLFVFLIAILSGCRKKDSARQAAGAEPHPESVTNWTTKTELFAEYHPLISGETSRFTIHLTRLDTFKPVTKGRVEVRLSVGGKNEVFSADAPLRPGIFGVDVK